MLQPFESIMPVITNPHLNANKPLPLEIVNKVRLLTAHTCSKLAWNCYQCLQQLSKD